MHFRPARLGEVVAELLAHILAIPTLIIVEDTHWMDDAVVRPPRPVVRAG